MALFNWSQKYSTGIKSIDDQHIKLFAIINSLHDAIINNKSSQDIVKNMLSELISYTQKHFLYEENLLTENNYPDMDAHFDGHNKLVSDLTGYKSKFENGELGEINELLTFAIEWLQNHILISDMAYSGFLIRRGVK
ncbi:MAG: hemerythrin family protein [Leptospiraceae bacterium]|nr:hemerythrin family protein [Leptospiraceae bacterium]